MMSTPFHAVFNAVFVNVYFVLVILKIQGQKMRVSASNQKSVSEKSIFAHFEVIFFNV